MVATAVYVIGLLMWDQLLLDISCHFSTIWRSFSARFYRAFRLKPFPWIGGFIALVLLTIYRHVAFMCGLCLILLSKRSAIPFICALSIIYTPWMVLVLIGILFLQDHLPSIKNLPPLYTLAPIGVGLLIRFTMIPMLQSFTAFVVAPVILASDVYFDDQFSKIHRMRSRYYQIHLSQTPVWKTLFEPDVVPLLGSIMIMLALIPGYGLIACVSFLCTLSFQYYRLKVHHLLRLSRFFRDPILNGVSDAFIFTLCFASFTLEWLTFSSEILYLLMGVQIVLCILWMFLSTRLEIKK